MSPYVFTSWGGSREGLPLPGRYTWLPDDDVAPLARAVAENPALAAIAAAGDGARARALAAEAAAILATPPGDARAGGAPGQDAALLRANPLLGAAHQHYPAAALDLLARVKQAGGTRR